MSEYLALVVKHARSARGLTQEQAGAALHVSASLIAMIETGRRVPHPDTARQLDEVLGTGDLITKMSVEARKGVQEAWFRPLPEYEKGALAVRSYENQIIPGLLQTEAYARAVLTSGLLTPKQAEQHVAIRQDRQAAVLDRSEPAVCTFIIDEDALWRGDREVLKEQLCHLADIGARPRVFVHVTPRRAGMHPGQNGPLMLLSLDGGETVGYVDDPLEGRIVADANRVAALEQVWQAVNAVALPCDQSQDLIMKLVDEL